MSAQKKLMLIEPLEWDDPLITESWEPDEIEFLRGPKSHPVVRCGDTIRFDTEPVVLMVHELHEVSLNQLWVIFSTSDNPKAIESLMEYYRDLGYSLCGFWDVFGEFFSKKDEEDE